MNELTECEARSHHVEICKRFGQRATPVDLFLQAIRAGGHVFFSGHVMQDPAAGKLFVELLRGPEGAPRNDPQRRP